MPSKKDIFGNWTEKRMCGDYQPVNRKTKSDRYPTPTPEELFDAVGHSRVFSTLDLRSGYHQLPLMVEDRVKTAFWELIRMGEINFTTGNFFHLASKTHLQSFRG
jgi:hypothetical protein